MRHALQLLQSGLQASFVLATVWVPGICTNGRCPPDAEVLDRMTGAVGGRALAGAEALLNASGVPYEREIASGEPAPALIDLARRHGCDAIIMGALGRGALRSALLGSRASEHLSRPTRGAHSSAATSSQARPPPTPHGMP